MQPEQPLLQMLEIRYGLLYHVTALLVLMVLLRDMPEAYTENSGY